MTTDTADYPGLTPLPLITGLPPSLTEIMMVEQIDLHNRINQPDLPDDLAASLLGKRSEQWEWPAALFVNGVAVPLVDLSNAKLQFDAEAHGALTLSSEKLLLVPAGTRHLIIQLGRQLGAEERRDLATTGALVRAIAMLCTRTCHSVALQHYGAGGGAAAAHGVHSDVDGLAGRAAPCAAAICNGARGL